MVDNFVPFFVELDIVGFKCEKLFRSSSVQIYGIYLRTGRELGITGIGQQIGLEEHFFAVRSEGYGYFGRWIPGQTLRSTSRSIDKVHIHTSFTVGSESNALAVGWPYGLSVVSRMGCQLSGTSAFAADGVDVTFVIESNGLSIRRNCRITHP